MPDPDNFSFSDIQPDPSYLASLSFHDLQRLRASVRRIQGSQLEKQLSDYECDQIISSFGPRVREKYIKMQVEAKLGR